MSPPSVVSESERESMDSLGDRDGEAERAGRACQRLVMKLSGERRAVGEAMSVFDEQLLDNWRVDY